MLDFPNSPTTGTIFASGGLLWRYDGTKWTPASGVLAIPDAPSDGHTYGRDNAAWNSVDAMLAPVSANANGALNNTGRNLIHNGLFNVAQRGAGPWAGIEYTVDRWLIAVTTDTSTTAQAALADTDRAAIGDEAAINCATISFTGSAVATANTRFIHNVEGVRRLGGKTVTLSFYAYASAAGLHLGANIAQYFGSGGTPSAEVNGNGQAVTLTTAWARYSLTFTVPSTSGKTLGTNGNDYTALTFWVSSGSSTATEAGIGVQTGTINLYGVQLEIGSVATPLAKRDPADELVLCQRFYRAGFVGTRSYAAAASGYFQAPYSFGPEMRAAPTVALPTQISQTNLAGATAGTVTADMFIFQIQAAGAGDVYALYAFTASADL